MLARRNLTAMLVSALAADTNFAVGDSHVPEAGTYGWSGTPGAIGSEYRPYSIITPMAASRPSGPLADSHADWQIPYSLSSFGTTREQAEWIADLARTALIDQRGLTFDGGDGTYTIQQVRVESIGGMQRSDQLEPPTFGQTDTIAVWITKGI